MAASVRRSPHGAAERGQATWVDSDSDAARRRALFVGTGRCNGKPGVARLPRSKRESPVDMAHAALAPLIGAQFDKFLYAPIREDRNGTPLTVLSALARLDVDPWQEAVSLARMPSEAAAVRLTALIAALPDEPNRDVPAKMIAADLVTLLPKAAGFTVGPSDGVFAAVGPQRPQIRFALSALAILAMIALALSASLSSPPGNGAKPSAAPVGDATTTSLHERKP